MVNRIFSVNYSAIHQRRFVEALEGEDLERAEGILDSLPPDQNYADRLLRLTVRA